MENIFDKDSKAAIVNRLNSLTIDSKPQWGTMNVSQMMLHCCKPIEVANGHPFEKPNIFLRMIGSMIKHKLYNDEPFKQNLPTAKSFIVTDKVEFEASKKELLTKIEELFMQDKNSVGARPHPFFGSLTGDQWGRGMWKHLDHHLRQFGA